MDFTVPHDVSPDLDLQLTRLVKDFHDGYLTEKGYIKKRMELLNSKPAISATESEHSTSTSDAMNTPSTKQLSSFQSPSNSDYNTDDFYGVTQVVSHSIEDSSNTQSVFDNNEFLEKYNNISKNNDLNIRKELQKPLDPRDVFFDTEPPNDSDNLTMILRKRAKLYEKEPALLVIDEKGREDKVLTWDKLYYRAQKIAKQIKNKVALYTGDRVCLIYQNVEIIDFMVAFYGCFFAGVVAVPLNSSTPVKELVSIMNDTQSHLCLMSDSVFKYFEKQEKQAKTSFWPKGMTVWKTSDMGTYKPSKKDGDPPLKVSDLAYIDYTKDSSGELKGVVISHRTLLNQMDMVKKILSTSPDIKNPLVRSTLKISRSMNNILSTLDVRNSIGLIMSILFTVYSGNLFVWIHSQTASTPGLFANILSSYRISVMLTDYTILKDVVYNYQLSPQTTKSFSKKKVDLSSVCWCLIDSHTVDCEFNEILSDRWFRPLGNKRSKRIISPILTLNEHGGAIISMRDWFGNEDKLGCIFNQQQTFEMHDEFGDDDSQDQLSEVLIDKSSLSTNSVKLIDNYLLNSVSSTISDSDYVRVGSFGYPLPDATLALVNPETNVLSGVSEVGEIWVDSNCISGGFWGLPEDTENLFQAECSDYDGILSLKFVRTGLLGFIYNGKVYVLGLYEDRINQRVTWYDQYLEFSKDENNSKNTINNDNSRKSMNSDFGANYMNSMKEYSTFGKIDLSKNLSNRYVYKYHYSNHLVKTLAKNLAFFKDCAFFNLKVNKEYLPVAIMESDMGRDKTKSNQVELQSMLTEAFNLLEKYHNIRLFFIIVTKPGALSRTLKSGRLEIGNTLTKRRFLEGRIPSVYVSFKPYNSLGSIYHGYDLAGGIWSPFSTSIRDDMLSYARYQSSGLDARDSSRDDRSRINLADFSNPIKLLAYRAEKQSDELSFAQIEGTFIDESKQLTTWKKLENKIFSICSYILEKQILSAGDYVIIFYPLCEEYISCLIACWMAGFIVIPMSTFGQNNQSVDEDVESLVNVIKEYNVKAIFVNNSTEASFKNKTVSTKLKAFAMSKRVTIPKLRNTVKHSKTISSGRTMYKTMERYREKRHSKSDKKFCMVWLNFSSDNVHTSVKINFKNIMSMCLSVKETCQMSVTTPIIGCANYTSGLGFLLSAMMGIYIGTTTYLMSYAEYNLHSKLFFKAIERYKIDNVFIKSQMFLNALAKNSLKDTNLKFLKNIMIGWASDRANPAYLDKHKEKLVLSNIKEKSISNIYSHELNPLISTRSFLSFEPIILWLDPDGLAQGYISLVNPKDSPSAIAVVDSGIVSVNTEVVIVNPQTEQMCKIGEFGEIWVSSESNAMGFAGDDDNITNKEYFCGRLKNRNSNFVRTGDFGFLHNVTKTTQKENIVEMQLLYNLGKIDETFEYCGLQFFSKDIEECMESFDGISKCCVFKAGEYTILVVDTATKRSLSTVAPLMILKLLNRFKIVIDIISFVDSNGLMTSKNGSIRRMIIAKKWMNRTLKIKESFGISCGENEMIKAVHMQEWVEDRLTK